MSEQFTVTLQAESPHPIPSEVRLRRFLKMALRAFALKCIDVQETHANDVGVQEGERALTV